MFLTPLEVTAGVGVLVAGVGVLAAGSAFRAAMLTLRQRTVSDRQVLEQRASSDRLALQQKAASDAHTAWWLRAQWAIDKSLSSDPETRRVGTAAMTVLARDPTATVADLEVLDAAFERSLDSP